MDTAVEVKVMAQGAKVTPVVGVTRAVLPTWPHVPQLAGDLRVEVVGPLIT